MLSLARRDRGAESLRVKKLTERDFDKADAVHFAQAGLGGVCD